MNVSSFGLVNLSNYYEQKKANKSLDFQDYLQTHASNLDGTWLEKVIPSDPVSFNFHVPGLNPPALAGEL